MGDWKERKSSLGSVGTEVMRRKMRVRVRVTVRVRVRVGVTVGECNDNEGKGKERKETFHTTLTLSLFLRGTSKGVPTTTVKGRDFGTPNGRFHCPKNIIGTNPICRPAKHTQLRMKYKKGGSKRFIKNRGEVE